MSSGAAHLTAPPAGFNSVSLLDSSLSVCYQSLQVLVEIGSGEDELVVFDNDAIRPSYLIMYGS